MKAVELKAVGKGYPRGGLRHRTRAAGQHRRRRHHRRHRRRRSHPPGLRSRRPSRRRRWRRRSRATRSSSRRISLPVMTATELDESIYWEAEQYIPFDIQDVNLDYQILDAGPRHRCQGHDGSAARRGEEGEDRRLHRRDRAGGADAGGGRRRRVRAAERVRAELRLRAGCGRRAAQRGRERHQHQHHRQRTVGLHTRYLARRQRVSPKRCSGS